VTIPPIGAIGSVLSQSVAGLGPGEATSAGASAGVGGLQSATGLSPSAPAAGAEQTTGASSGVGGVGGISGAESPPASGGVEGGESGGFGEALTQAISSLDQTQQSADGAAQALATGTASNPESAVVTVEDAQLAMQLASQIRTKAVEAAQQIFQTQV
jgi:flagellar hook-basal body complex protein FliE